MNTTTPPIAKANNATASIAASRIISNAKMITAVLTNGTTICDRREMTRAELREMQSYGDDQFNGSTYYWTEAK